MKLLYTVAEAADALGVTENFVYTLCRKGALEKRYIGKATRNFRIPADSLEGYVAALPTEPKDAA